MAAAWVVLEAAALAALVEALEVVHPLEVSPVGDRLAAEVHLVADEMGPGVCLVGLVQLSRNPLLRFVLWSLSRRVDCLEQSCSRWVLGSIQQFQRE